nr:hypothetical protein [Tanacetum cinerariifolium]
MNPFATQQVALDTSLVDPKKRLKIENAMQELRSANHKEKKHIKLLNQEFVVPPSEEELVTFIQELGYSGKCDMLSGVYNKKNFDYIALLWEDFMYQADNREISSARKEHMPYPRFTKVIINHIISKDKTIFMRSRINLHTIYDDSLLGTLKFVSKTQDYQQYGALIPDDMINQDIKYSKAYKTYYDFATGKATPKKAKKYKKVASPSRKLSPVFEEEHAVKHKKAKKPTKKSTTVPTTGVVIRDTPGVSVSKKKAPTKVDRGKGMDLLSDTTLFEDYQVKEALKKSKKGSHMLHPSGSGDGVGSQPKVPNEFEDKTTGTDERTVTKPGVPDVQYQSESENESWGDSKDDDNDDDHDDFSKGDDDKVDSNDDDGNDAQDSEMTDSDEEENPNLNLKVDEYIHTLNYYVPTDEETNDENKEFDDEEYDELYKDVNMRLKVIEHKEVRKGDAEMTDVTHESSKQISSLSSEFASKFLKLDNVPLVIDEVASMMNVKVRQEESSTQAPPIFSVLVTALSETSTILATTVSPSIQPFTTIPQQSTPTPAPTTAPTTTFFPTLPDFSSLFGFDQRVSTLEKELAQFKQVDHSAQIHASIKS